MDEYANIVSGNVAGLCQRRDRPRARSLPDLAVVDGTRREERAMPADSRWATPGIACDLAIGSG
jgi:hypothetical protein